MKIDKSHQGYIYMLDVLNGNIPAGKPMIQACQRAKDEFDELEENGAYKDYIFRQDIADYTIELISEYKHFKGDFAGQCFEPTPSQMFFFWQLFGWVRKDTGTRRFTEVYRKLARKNGKSFEAGVVGVYMFLDDLEQGAECYCVATKGKQAQIVFDNVKAIIRKTERLRESASILKYNISCAETMSKFEFLSRDSKTEDGLNPHFVSMDEWHAFTDNSMAEVLDSAFGGRSQPLFMAITTAGSTIGGPCHTHEKYCLNVLDPKHPAENDDLLITIYDIDKDDDIYDEMVWEKANPNINYIPTIKKKIRAAANKAKHKPSELSNFKTKHLNVWVNASSPWISVDDWKQCDGEVNYRDLLGRKCYAGLDLASTEDLTALSIVFPPLQRSMSKQRDLKRKEYERKLRYDNSELTLYQQNAMIMDAEDEIGEWLDRQEYVKPDPYYVLTHFFVPSVGLQKRSKEHGVNYDTWARDPKNNLHVTDGKTTDYNHILHELDRARALYDIRTIGYDRHSAVMLVKQIEDDFGIDCVEVQQTFGGMSYASKEFEMLVRLGLLRHNNNDVLTWNAMNVVCHEGPSGNYKPDKRKSGEKIDGIVALIMALGLSILNESKDFEYNGVMAF